MSCNSQKSDIQKNHTGQLKAKNYLLDYLLLISCTLFTNCYFAYILGFYSPLHGDALFYIGIAESLSEYRGYTNPYASYPNTPELGRLPLWPAILACVYWLFPEQDNLLLVRLTTSLLNTANVLLLYILTLRIYNIRAVAILSGLAYSIFPSAISFAYEGLSEISFITILLLSLLAINKNNSIGPLSGFLLGSSVLIRSSFGAFIGFFVLVIFFNKRKLDSTTKFKNLALFTVCFLMPTFIWIARNYSVTGEFPVLSTIRGETVYGAYNDLTGNTLKYWGYWVFPDEIPGQAPKSELIKTMVNDRELDEFYYLKGIEWIKSNYTKMPRLLLGRLIRAYSPIPWEFSIKNHAAFLFRFLIYITFFWALKRIALKTSPIIYLFTISFIFTNLFTVLVFFGSARFAFQLEPFLIPGAALGVYGALQRARNWLPNTD